MRLNFKIFTYFFPSAFFIIPLAAMIPVAPALTISLESPAPSPATKRLSKSVSMFLFTLTFMACSFTFGAYSKVEFEATPRITSSS